MPAVTSQRRVAFLLHPTPQPLPAVSKQRKPLPPGSFLPASFKTAGWLLPSPARAFHGPAGRGPQQSSFPWGWSGAQRLPSFSSFWVSGPRSSGDFPGAGKGEVKHPLGADGTFPDGWLSGVPCCGCGSRDACWGAVASAASAQWPWEEVWRHVLFSALWFHSKAIARTLAGFW